RSRADIDADDVAPTDTRRTHDMDTKTTLIDGVWTAPKQRRAVTTPGTGDVVGSVCWGTADEARRAADAAGRAFASWAGTSARARADILLRAADLLTERRDEIARILAAEAGKRLPEAVGELAFSAEYIRCVAEEVRRPQGSVGPQEDAARPRLRTRRAAGAVGA